MKKLKIIDFILIAIISVMLTGAIAWAASVYPVLQDLTGGGTGALDKITGTVDEDGALVLLNADHGSYPGFGAGYSLDADGGAGDLAPWRVDSGDTGEDWIMVKWWGLGLATGNAEAGPGFVEFYEDTDNGSNKVTLIGPATTADVTLTLQAITGTVYSSGGTDVVDADVADNITITNISQVADISASASEINTPLDGASVSLTEFQELEAIDSTTISANQWAALGGIAETLTSGELDILDGVTANATELNYLDIASLGTGAASKAVALDGSGNYAAPAGAWDLGGATSFEIPNAADPDVDAAGEITHDTDGANENADESFRGYDGAAQFLVARKIKCIHATIANPQDLDDTDRDRFVIWGNNTGMLFTITEIKAYSDVDDTTLNVELVTATNWTTRGTIDAIEIAADGTGVYTDTETTISDDEVEHDEMISLDFDDTDDPGIVKITICGWFNADID